MSKKLLRIHRGLGKLETEGESVSVKYEIGEYAHFVSDGLGGEVPRTGSTQGRIYHADGHPDWHPIAALSSKPMTLVLEDGRKLDVILETPTGSVRGTGAIHK